MLDKARLIALLVAVAVVAAHIAETLSTERLFTRSDGDMRSYARLLQQDGDQRQPACLTSSGAEEPSLAVLMRAIMTVETHASSGLERLVEATAIRGAVLLGMPVPDFSLGLGQIRPSTAIKALRSVGPPGTGTAPPPPQVALRLLQPCDSLRIGIAVLAWISRRNGLDHRELTKHEIFAIAGRYNADGGGDGLEGALAVRLYQMLVFHTYQELRFRALSSG